MRSVILEKEGFYIKQADMPVCKDDEVLVRTISCGICEGDVVAYKSVLNGGLSEGLPFGHEGTGIIEKIGPLARKLSIGDLVTVNGCRFGGNYNEYFLVNESDVYTLPCMADALAIHGEPAACCVHGMGRSGIGLRSRVAVLGCGYMGLICLRLALLQGAREIVAVDPIEWRLKFAKEFGASSVYTGSADDLSGLGEFDVVIEAAGVPQTLDIAVDLVKEHGRILVFGAHRSEGGMRNLNMFSLNYKAVDLVNAHIRRDDEKMDALAEAMELILDGRIEVKKLVTTYPINDINTAMQDLIARKEGLFKASVVY